MLKYLGSLGFRSATYSQMVQDKEFFALFLQNFSGMCLVIKNSTCSWEPIRIISFSRQWAKDGHPCLMDERNEAPQLTPAAGGQGSSQGYAVF